MPRHIELDELRSDHELEPLTEEAGDALHASGLVNCVRAGEGMWRLTPAGRVGAVQLDDLLVSVQPKEKVGISQLLFLLGYAKDAGFRPEDVDGVNGSDLWAAPGESLARQGERALARGALYGYVHVEESLRTVRGRIRISDQLTRRPGMLLPLEVSFDDHTIDIPENRILRAAVRVMVQIPRLDDVVRRRLHHLDSKLEGVTTLRRGAALPSWTPSRANARYVSALRLAAVMLRNCAAESGLGGVRVASFVVNMATVFEDFATVALTEALARYPGNTRAQYPAYLDEEQGISMRVDVVHSFNGRPAVVYDAKYKAASSSGQYPNADHYQMLAYCTALKVRTAWLVYAGAGGAQRRRILNTGVDAVEYPLDLSRSPREVLSSVEQLALQSSGGYYSGGEYADRRPAAIVSEPRAY